VAAQNDVDARHKARHDEIQGFATRLDPVARVS